MMQWFKIKKPKDPSQQFKNKNLIAYRTAEDAIKRQNPEIVRVEQIRGNFTHQTMFEINGTHLVSMLDAYCHLNREPLPNQEFHEAFLSTVSESVVSESTLKKVDPLQMQIAKERILNGEKT